MVARHIVSYEHVNQGEYFFTNTFDDFALNLMCTTLRFVHPKDLNKNPWLALLKLQRPPPNNSEYTEYGTGIRCR